MANTIFNLEGSRRFIDKSDDLNVWTVDELRQGIADYQAIIDRCDDSEYNGVAEGDCCADSRDLLAAELDRRLAAALDQIGLRPVGFSREQAFHEGAGEIAEKSVQQIEEMMGGAMPDDIKSVIYLVIERAANLTGPQLTVTYPGDGVEQAAASVPA